MASSFRTMKEKVGMQRHLLFFPILLCEMEFLTLEIVRVSSSLALTSFYLLLVFECLSILVILTILSLVVKLHLEETHLTTSSILWVVLHLPRFTGGQILLSGSVRYNYPCQSPLLFLACSEGCRKVVREGVAHILSSQISSEHIQPS